MGKPFIFISCGQVTDEEKALGNQIVRLVKDVTGLDAFFAQDVHDLNGLDTNILRALHDCVAFIAVMHPRGEITRLDGTRHVRASVWIEQEIAIATYIQRIENRSLPIVPFIHREVGREGLRDLLHLNPYTFSTNAEVLNKLPELLKPWKGLSTALRIELYADNRHMEDGHVTHWLWLRVINDTNDAITKLNSMVKIPAGLFRHWTTRYMAEVQSDNPSVRIFRLDLTAQGEIQPRSTQQLISFQICPRCAVDFTGEGDHIGGKIVGGSMVEAKAWVSGKEYSFEATVEELLKAAADKRRPETFPPLPDNKPFPTA